MSTIVIKTADNPQERFEVDLANEPSEFADEFRKFVSKLRGRKQASKRKTSKKPNPQKKRASENLRSIKNDPENIENLSGAQETR